MASLDQAALAASAASALAQGVQICRVQHMSWLAAGVLKHTGVWTQSPSLTMLAPVAAAIMVAQGLCHDTSCAITAKHHLAVLILTVTAACSPCGSCHHGSSGPVL